MVVKKEGGGDPDMDIRFEPALGRNFKLGDFYDARKDLPLSGYSFWHEDVIKENTEMEHKVIWSVQNLFVNKPIYFQYYSNTRFFAENEANDRIGDVSTIKKIKEHLS